MYFCKGLLVTLLATLASSEFDAPKLPQYHQSAATPSQIKFAEDNLYDQTGPGSWTRHEGAYKTYKTLEEALSGYLGDPDTKLPLNERAKAYYAYIWNPIPANIEKYEITQPSHERYDAKVEVTEQNQYKYSKVEPQKQYKYSAKIKPQNNYQYLYDAKVEPKSQYSYFAKLEQENNYQHDANLELPPQNQYNGWTGQDATVELQIPDQHDAKVQSLKQYQDDTKVERENQYYVFQDTHSKDNAVVDLSDSTYEKFVKANEFSVKDEPKKYRPFRPIALNAAESVTRINDQPLPIQTTQKLATFDVKPHYTFSYGVHDRITGDSKTVHETRNGDTVRGYYTVMDPDGQQRTVRYSADDKNGFQADVQRTPTNTSPF